MSLSLFSFLLFVLSLLLRPAVVAADLHVFIYHRFGESSYPTTNVAVDRFQAQMAYLRENGYRVVPLAEVVTALKERRPLPERGVVITIDDGYASVYHAAWPILRSFGYPFTVFLNIQAVDRGFSNILTWQQIDEMRRAGVDFEDHSYAHHRLADWPAGMDEQDYRRWISTDLARGARILADRLGRRPRYLAIPYGEYNEIVIDEAKKVGYAAVLSQDPGVVSSDTDPFLIPREPILGYDWATMEHFVMVLNRSDLPCVDMKPPLAPLTGSDSVTISARLLHPERYDPDSLDIYVSELGWLPASLVGDRLAIRSPVVLHRRLNRVAVGGREKASGRAAIRFWMLLRPPGR